MAAVAYPKGIPMG